LQGISRDLYRAIRGTGIALWTCRDCTVPETKQATMSQAVPDDTLDPGGSVNTANKQGDLLPVIQFISHSVIFE